MSRFLLLILLSGMAWGAAAAEQAALQDGLRTFANYCLSCHSLQYQRYERVAQDLGIPEALMRDNLIFTGDEFTAPMRSSLSPEDAKHWLGAVPPDLTLVATVRGEAWLSDFLQSFYEDASRPHGVNNLLLPNLAMPHVLAAWQGRQVLNCTTPAPCTLTHVANSGQLSPEVFTQRVANLVAFLAYCAAPYQADSQRLGAYVLGFLGIFSLLTFWLKREYWRDIV